jgi:hypothetical protein
MSTSSYAGPTPAARTQSLFGRVMGLVALTVVFATLGVWAARNLGGGDGSSPGCSPSAA